MERRGNPFTERHPHAHRADILLPEQPSVHVVRVDSSRSEARDQRLAVRHGRVRGEAAVLAVIALVRFGRGGSSAPDLPARFHVDCNHQEVVLDEGSGLGVRSGLSGGRQIDPSVRNHRSGVALAGNPDPPLDVLRGGKRQRSVALGDAVVVRSAPLPPRVLGLGARTGRDAGCQHQPQSELSGALRRERGVTYGFQEVCEHSVLRVSERSPRTAQRPAGVVAQGATRSSARPCPPRASQANEGRFRRPVDWPGMRRQG